MRHRPLPALRPILVAATTLALLTPTGLPATAAATGAATSEPPMLTVPGDSTAPSPGSTATPSPGDTANEFVDLDRELSECVGNSLAKPGCGREPTHSGDRGSAMQWSVFGLMGVGLAFIGWRIVAGVRRTRTT